MGENKFKDFFFPQEILLISKDIPKPNVNIPYSPFGPSPLRPYPEMIQPEPERPEEIVYEPGDVEPSAAEPIESSVLEIDYSNINIFENEMILDPIIASIPEVAQQPTNEPSKNIFATDAIISKFKAEFDADYYQKSNTLGSMFETNLKRIIRYEMISSFPSIVKITKRKRCW